MKRKEICCIAALMTKKAINNQVKLNQMIQAHQTKKAILTSHNLIPIYLILLKHNNRMSLSQQIFQQIMQIKL